jgi:hypothetical protein
MKLLQKISRIIAEEMPATPEIIIQSKGSFHYSSSDSSMPRKDAAYYRAFHALKRLFTPMELVMQIIVHSNLA